MEKYKYNTRLVNIPDPIKYKPLDLDCTCLLLLGRVLTLCKVGQLPKCTYSDRTAKLELGLSRGAVHRAIGTLIEKELISVVGTRGYARTIIPNYQAIFIEQELTIIVDNSSTYDESGIKYDPRVGSSTILPSKSGEWDQVRSQSRIKYDPRVGSKMIHSRIENDQHIYNEYIKNKERELQELDRNNIKTIRTSSCTSDRAMQNFSFGSFQVANKNFSCTLTRQAGLELTQKLKNLASTHEYRGAKLNSMEVFSYEKIVNLFLCPDDKNQACLLGNEYKFNSIDTNNSQDIINDELAAYEHLFLSADEFLELNDFYQALRQVRLDEQVMYTMLKQELESNSSLLFQDDPCLLYNATLNAKSIKQYEFEVLLNQIISEVYSDKLKLFEIFKSECSKSKNKSNKFLVKFIDLIAKELSNVNACYVDSDRWSAYCSTERLKFNGNFFNSMNMPLTLLLLPCVLASPFRYSFIHESSYFYLALIKNLIGINKEHGFLTKINQGVFNNLDEARRVSNIALLNTSLENGVDYFAWLRALKSRFAQIINANGGAL